MEETITPIPDETGNASHFVAVMQDITEALNRQEQEVQLRLARQIQQKFYRAAPSCLASTLPLPPTPPVKPAATTSTSSLCPTIV